MPDNKPNKWFNKKTIVYVILAALLVIVAIAVWYFSESQFAKILAMLSVPAVLGLGDLIRRFFAGDSTVDAPPPEVKKKKGKGK